MSILNIFTQDAFSVMRLTDALREIKYTPSRIGQMGLFQTTSIDTLDIGIKKDKEKNRMLVSATGGEIQESSAWGETLALMEADPSLVGIASVLRAEIECALLTDWHRAAQELGIPLEVADQFGIGPVSDLDDDPAQLAEAAISGGFEPPVIAEAED